MISDKYFGQNVNSDYRSPDYGIQTAGPLTMMLLASSTDYTVGYYRTLDKTQSNKVLNLQIIYGNINQNLKNLPA